MKNILRTEKDLELFNKEGKRVYWFRKYSDGYSWERTYDSNGNELTFKDSRGYGWEYTYDSNGNVLTYKDSDGYSSEYTYDSNGKELTFKDSDGIKRGFDIPEYTR
jgi:YD repeat-containing protein